MNIVLLADLIVGSEVTKYLVKNYKSDIYTVCTTEKNEIYKFAKKSGLRCLVFKNENDLIQKIDFAKIDLGILAWWPKILSENLIKKTKYGFINAHNSLLPNARGKHPYFWTIVEEKKYGVTWHRVNNKVDKGDIIAQEEIFYNWEDTAETLYTKSIKQVIKLFKKEYPSLRKGNIKSRPQKGKGSFHYGKEMDVYGRIFLNKKYTGKDILNLIRGRTTSSKKIKSAFFEDNGELYRVKIFIKKEM